MVAALLTGGLMLFFILGSIRYWGPAPTSGHFLICTVVGISGATLSLVVMMQLFREEIASYTALLSLVMALAGCFVAVAGMLRVDLSDDENQPSPS
jgi:membrane-associated protease RseP (regulator of RpoE activity)